MMEDLLNIVADILEDKNYEIQIVSDDICIKKNVEGYEVEVVCRLGKYFPYEFPTIYASDETWKNVPAMPHKNTDGSICTFDKNIAVPNYNKPKELIVETIEKAFKIISDGIKGINRIDYMDEFIEYWRTKTDEVVSLFVENSLRSTEIYSINKDGLTVASDDIDRLFEIHQSTIGQSIDDVTRGLFIVTDGNIANAIPKTDVDFLRYCKENSRDWNKLELFIQKNINTSSFYVVICECVDNTSKFFGWRFNGPGVPNGFRKGHVDLWLAFSGSKSRGKAVVVNDCSQRRLFTRGGDGRDTNVKRVCIVGCGSIGSYVAEALMNSGVESFNLVDNDVLTCENVARHFNGFEYIGCSKVNAVKQKMCMHNPNIKCEANLVNAFEFFNTSVDSINQCDLTVLAVAYSPLEQYVIEKINAAEVTSPVLIIWIEPYAVAGHAILISNPIDVFDELFDIDTLEYQYSVVENPETFNKREAGCQSSYMPYAALEEKNMIYSIFVPCIKRYIKTGNSYRFTWCGDLCDARERGITINKNYDDVANYSLAVERLD